jgi:hypothetical protein
MTSRAAREEKQYTLTRLSRGQYSDQNVKNVKNVNHAATNKNLPYQVEYQVAAPHMP